MNEGMNEYYPFLIEAQKSIKQVAEKINKGMKSAEEVERNARIVQEIESHIEGMEDMTRWIYLGETSWEALSGFFFFPAHPGSCQSSNRDSIQKAICRLDEDLSTLGQVSKLSETLSFPHQTLDDVIKDLMAAIHRELTEKQSVSFSLSFPPNKMELTITKSDSTDSHIFEFPNPDARHSFEQGFEDAKKKLASNKNCLDPEFLKAIPIMKTRSGMQVLRYTTKLLFSPAQ
ncbi:Rho guanine nucleotide exchange factor 17, partial [Ophiophagus hannah]